jgi:sigma-B regulation protein RsbU (phosphoserine phosphatase)
MNVENASQVRGLARGPAESFRHPRRSGAPGARLLADQLAAVRRDYDSLRRAMYEAAQQQRKLCGPRLLRRGPYEVASEIFPVRDLSGDFTCVFEHSSDLVFAIGDIAGKGLSAAMWFTHVVGLVRLQIEALKDPAAVLSAINRDLLLSRLGLPLTTMFLARLDTRTGEVTYCSAGHPPTVVLRSRGRIDSLHEGGPVLGVLPDAQFVNGRTFLYPGDALLGYSDGIAECRNEHGVEYGAERVTDVARLFQAAGASSVLFSVLGAAEDFAGSLSREDDMALIVVHRSLISNGHEKTYGHV